MRLASGSLAPAHSGKPRKMCFGGAMSAAAAGRWGTGLPRSFALAGDEGKARHRVSLTHSLGERRIGIGKRGHGEL